MYIFWETVKPELFPESAIVHSGKKLLHMLLYNMGHNYICRKMVLNFLTSEKIFLKLLMMWLGIKGRNGEEEDEEVTAGLSVTFRISVVFNNSPLLTCLLVLDSSN